MDFRSKSPIPSIWFPRPERAVADGWGMYLARAMNQQESTGDALVRWLDRDATLRIAAVDATCTARGVTLLHDLQGDDARDLSLAMAGVLLLASDLKSLQTLSVQIEIDARTMHVDATPEGLVRAMLVPRRHEALVARVAVRRMGTSGLLYQSVVDVPSLEVAEALEGYVLHSEQLPARLDLRCELDELGSPMAVRGALVRGFPATPRDSVEGLFAAWDRRGAWSAEAPCEGLDDRQWDRLSYQPVQHHCPCSRERALGSIRALGEDSLRQAAERGETMEVICDFCRSAYAFAPDDFLPSASGG